MEAAMQDRFAFPAAISWWDEDKRFFVRFAAPVEWIFTTGRDRADARLQAIDALEVGIASYMREGKDIPRPSRSRNGPLIVAMGPLMTAKAALYEAMREKGMSNVALAKKLGVAETEVRRLLSPRHNSKIERLDKALAVFGKHIVVRIAAE
jgi:antitoxin HicB